MLTGKLVRVKNVKQAIKAQYIDPDDSEWQNVAERLLEMFRRQNGRTRGEVEEELKEIVGDHPGQLVHQGLAKLLEDRCTFETVSERPPDEIRQRVFQLATQQRQATSSAQFDRETILASVAAELGTTSEEIDRSLFADLKDEQRLREFDDCTVEQILNRYNTALAQAVLLRATNVTIDIYGESPQRYRHLFRAIKFHQLICDITQPDERGYRLKLDGPLSLFSSTQKYGFQLACFFPSVLQCKRFELSAKVRWGTKRVEKKFHLSSSEGLKSNQADYASYIPKELELFCESFRNSIEEWEISTEVNLVSLGAEGVWVPDFKLTHRKTSKVVHLEILGFWRRTDAEKHYRKLLAGLGSGFVLAVSDQFNIDEESSDAIHPGIYRFKRTPLPDEVARYAREQM
jgi:hypothetical protein